MNCLTDINVRSRNVKKAIKKRSIKMYVKEGLMMEIKRIMPKNPEDTIDTIDTNG
jgi:Tfp pilus assembly ATPase PilU